MAHYVIDDCCYDCLASDTVERLSLASLQRQTLFGLSVYSFQTFWKDVQIDNTDFLHYSWRWDAYHFFSGQCALRIH
jgi:hypothetical protein